MNESMGTGMRAYMPYMVMAWKAAKLYDTCFASIEKAHALTANERDILLFLHNNPGLNTAADVVQYRSISKSLVSKSVESLTRRGFLQSDKGTNRRCLHLSITPKARTAVTELSRAQQGFFAMLGEGLSEEECRVFNGVLKKMGENAQRYARKE